MGRLLYLFATGPDGSIHSKDLCHNTHSRQMGK